MQVGVFPRIASYKCSIYFDNLPVRKNYFVMGIGEIELFLRFLEYGYLKSPLRKPIRGGLPNYMSFSLFHLAQIQIKLVELALVDS